ncbi:MAG: hypothetical protein LM601_03635 [Candidatus Verstraetearchaeota archaeon]|nr:hypothetical protein [Candidatus Verstraetearchaeota archaeon]
MKKYLNKKYITIFSIIILAFILLGNYFTCPQYIKPIGLESFNGSLIWFKGIKFNSTIIHYSGFLGEADFGLIIYIPTPIFSPVTPRDIYEINVIVKKINEKTYNPLVKGFIITVEAINLFAYRNDTTIDWYATTSFLSYKSFPGNLSQSLFVYHIHSGRDYLPKTLYAHIDYAVHVIINPYAEIWYSEFKYITIGFHVKVYSGSITIPITIIIPG